MAKLLIIDDEKPIRKVLSDILRNENHEIDTAEDGLEALKLIKNKKYDIVFCDIKLPEKNGLEVLEDALKIDENIQFIMISGHGTIETAVTALKRGAYDFIEKPLDLNRILISLRNALEKASLESETKILRKKVKEQIPKTLIIGESDEIQKVRDIIDKVAKSDARVFIIGENGTGKELVARQLHEKSDRCNENFVEVNCAAIPKELIESELFGHEKGSFTSAISQKKGKFELANNGTIFLDEIGDMSLSAQAKVLRALQENKISRVGGNVDINVNVRVIAATNQNIKKMISENLFREDLYHRIAVIPMNVPTLRDRKEDIPLLINYFLEMICKEHGIMTKKINEDAVELLKNLKWTGNIRELKNVVERLIILSDSVITKNNVDLYANPNF